MKKQLHLSGYVGWYMCSDEYLKQWLRENSIKEGDDFEVVIFSGGGNAFEGIAMYNTLKAYRPTVVVNGIAGSAASLIACSGKQIKLTTGSQIMIHNPQSSARGESGDLKKVMNALKEVEESAIDIYAENCKLDREGVRQMMTETRFMRYEELKDKGFAVEMMEQAELQLDATAREVYAEIEMYGFPRHQAEGQKTFTNNDTNNHKDNEMPDNKDNNVDAAALATQLSAVQAELTAAQSTVTERDASLTKLVMEKKQLQNQLNAAAIAAVLATALENKKITPAQKEMEGKTLQALLTADKEVYDARVAALTADATKPAADLTASVANGAENGTAGESFVMKDFDALDPEHQKRAAELAYKLMETDDKLDFESALDKVVGG